MSEKPTHERLYDMANRLAGMMPDGWLQANPTNLLTRDVVFLRELADRHKEAADMDEAIAGDGHNPGPFFEEVQGEFISMKDKKS